MTTVWSETLKRKAWQTHLKNTVSHSGTMASTMTVFGTFNTKTTEIRLRPFCRDSLGKAKTKRHADCLEQHFFAESRTVLGCLAWSLWRVLEAEISWDWDPQVLSSCSQNHPFMKGYDMKGALPNLLFQTFQYISNKFQGLITERIRKAKQAVFFKAAPASLRRLHGQRTNQLCFQYSSQNGTAHGRAHECEHTSNIVDGINHAPVSSWQMVYRIILFPVFHSYQ